jgi:23S rRNA pseudouridine1911/1915/1917 synthase
MAVDGLDVGAAEAGARVDIALARIYTQYSRQQLQRLIADDAVEVNGTVVSKRHVLRVGDRVDILRWPVASEPPALVPQPMDLTILYEDDRIIVVDKPAGLAVHPGAGTPDGTLVNGLLAHAPAAFAPMACESERPGIVHRLDKDTSGVMVAAKDPGTRDDLIAAFAARTVDKTYLAVVCGVPEAPADIVIGAIGRHPRQRQRMAIVEGGKPAETCYATVAAGGNAALLVVRPKTGRTHQIRVHLAARGHPVVGDPIYGRRHGPAAPRLMLHAWRLGLPAGCAPDAQRVEAPPPPAWARACEALGLPEQPPPGDWEEVTDG